MNWFRTFVFRMWILYVVVTGIIAFVMFWAITVHDGIVDALLLVSIPQSINFFLSMGIVWAMGCLPTAEERKAQYAQENTNA